VLPACENSARLPPLLVFLRRRVSGDNLPDGSPEHTSTLTSGGAAPVGGLVTAAEASPVANLVLRTACGDVAMTGASWACRFHGGTRGSEPNRDVL